MVKNLYPLVEDIDEEDHRNKMWMPAIFFLILLLLIPNVEAYKVNFYGDANDHRSDVLEFLENIDTQYTEGLKLFRFYNCIDQWWAGLYFISGVIHIDTCYGYKKIILHELTHHLCWKQDKYLRHGGCFVENRLTKNETFINSNV